MNSLQNGLTDTVNKLWLPKGGERGGEGQTTMSKRDSVISLRMDLPFLLKKERLGLLSHCSF